VPFRVLRSEKSVTTENTKEHEADFAGVDGACVVGYGFTLPVVI